MKKGLVLGMAALMAVSAALTGCGSNSGNGGSKQTLKVYNAGEYIDLNVIRQFEDEYNCKVVYETFESNEMMYTKLSSGEQYDVLIPSDYMIEQSD